MYILDINENYTKLYEKFVNETSIQPYVMQALEGFSQADQDLIVNCLIHKYFSKASVKLALTSIDNIGTNRLGNDIRDETNDAIRFIIHDLRLYPIGAKKYNHAGSIGFEIKSDNEQPTSKEIINALKRRIEILSMNSDECQGAVDIYDTIEDEA